MHLSLLMYDTVNRNVPTSYLSNLFSNACENNPYKSKLRNTEYNAVLDHVPKTEYYKGSFSYRGGIFFLICAIVYYIPLATILHRFGGY